MRIISTLSGRIFRKLAALILVIVALLLLGDKLFAYIGKQIYPTKYSEYIEKYSKDYGVDIAFCYAMVKCESNFDPSAESAAGARGLMQLTDDTYNWLCSKIYGKELSDDLLCDPETNLRCGIYYLSYLTEQFGTRDEVIAAYNAGPAKVKEWLSDSEYSADGKTLLKTPYSETENHIKKVITAEERYNKLYDFNSQGAE